MYDALTQSLVGQPLLIVLSRIEMTVEIRVYFSRSNLLIVLSRIEICFSYGNIDEGYLLIVLSRIEIL